MPHKRYTNETCPWLDQNSVWNISAITPRLDDCVRQYKPSVPDKYLGHSTRLYWTLVHTVQGRPFNTIYVIRPLLQILNQFNDASEFQVSKRLPILRFLPLKRSGIYPYHTILGESILVLWWTKGQTDMLISEYFGFALPVSVEQSCKTHISFIFQRRYKAVK